MGLIDGEKPTSVSIKLYVRVCKQVSKNNTAKVIQKIKNLHDMGVVDVTAD